MKGPPGRAAASAVVNGHPTAAWGAFRARFRERGDDRFQDASEPYPRHWRGHIARLDRPLGREQLSRLPATWRAVLLARDAAHRPAEQVADALGVTVAVQQRILNRARAALHAAMSGSGS